MWSMTSKSRRRKMKNKLRSVLLYPQVLGVERQPWQNGMFNTLWACNKRRRKTLGVQEKQSMIWNRTSRSSCAASCLNSDKGKLPINLSPTIDKEWTRCFRTPNLSWPNEQEEESEIEVLPDANSIRLQRNQRLANIKDYGGDRNASI